MRRLFAFCVLPLLLLFVSGASGESVQVFSGMTLEDALRALQRTGVNVVYSSDLVRPEMVVENEPKHDSVKAMLKALLAPHGLKAEKGPSNTLLVVYDSRSRERTSPDLSAARVENVSNTVVLVPFVSISLIAMGKDNQFVTSLAAEDFELKENGRPQQIVEFSSFSALQEKEEPTVVLFLLDTSHSMSKTSGGVTRSDLLKEAALRMLDSFPEGTRFMAMEFSSGAVIISTIENTPEILKSTLAHQETGTGKTALYDAVLEAVQLLQTYPGRRIVLLCSDGEDNSSSISLQELLPRLGLVDVAIFSFAPEPTDPFAKRGADNLRRITEVTGGYSFFYSRTTAIPDLMVRMSDAIRSQYTLGYYPADHQMRGWRRLEIRCKVPNIRLRYRRSYLF
jgi:Ca-activated chloride channel family protein